MPLPYDKSAAIIVLPSLAGGRVVDSGLRRFLSRAAITRRQEPRELLASILDELNVPCPDEGLAALRMWGQTGDRPTVWIAAADPVYLEARLDHLRLHALHGELMPSADLRVIFEHLQKTLSDERRFGFARIGFCGYVRADEALLTAKCPASVIDGKAPNEYLPAGEDTGSFHRLLSEAEMALHDHEVNLRRQADGLPPVNSLWLWGGGYAPVQQTEPRPPLFASDPLLIGYWLSRTGVVNEWPGSIAACLDASVAGFVAVPGASDEHPDWLPACLAELRAALRSGRLSKVTLLLADGFIVHLQQSDAWKFWRRNTALFGPSA